MLTLFLTLISIMLPVWAEVPDAPRQGRTRTDASFSYFTSSANYKSGGGTIEDLPNGGEYSLGQLRAALAHDLSSELRFWAGLNAGFTTTNNGAEERTNSGLSEILGGAQYWVKMYRWRLVGQGDLFYPIFRVDEGSDQALVGEGAMRIRGGAWGIIPWGDLEPFVYLGVEYRDDGRSHLLPYAAGAKYRFGAWWVQGELRGFESLTDDENAGDTLARETFLNRVQGGSYKLYSVNPAQSEIAAEAGFDVDGFLVYGGISMVVNGSNTADGLTFMVGLGYTPDGTDYRRARKITPEEIETPARGDRNEDYFQNADPTIPPRQEYRPEPEEEERQEPPPPPPPSRKSDPLPEVILQKKPVKKKKPPKPILRPNPKTDRMMKDIEKELEKGL